MAAAAFADCETKKLKSRTRSVLSRKEAEGSRKFFSPQASVFCVIKSTKGRSLASLGMTSLCYVHTYEIFLAGKAGAVFLFVV
jgi:hypothetical protein